MASNDKPKVSEKSSLGARRGSKLGGLIKKVIILAILVGGGWYGYTYYQAHPELKDKILSKLGQSKEEATDDPLLRDASQQKQDKERMLEE